MRGSRVQAVVGELQGEKIDIIPWSSDPPTFVVNALAPAEVSKVVMDEEQRRIEVVVPDDQLSLAIGRRGQNVRLASQLTGWDIDILTEAEESERRTEEFRTRSQMFIDALDIDDVIAHLLVTEGFGSLEEVAYVAVEDLAEIEASDVDIAHRAAGTGAQRAGAARPRIQERFRQLRRRRRVATLDGLTPGMLVDPSAKTGIKTLDDFAGLAGDELVEMLAASEMVRREARARRRQRHDHGGPRPGALVRRRGSHRAGGEGVEKRQVPAHQVHLVEAEPEPAPQRRCIVTGEVRDRGALLRLSSVPTATIVPDVEARLPGRGLWLTPRARYSGTGGGEAGFRAGGAAAGLGAAELADGSKPAGAAVRRLAGSGAPAGLAVAGFDRVGEAVRRGGRLLLFALDGAEGGARKLARSGAICRRPTC
jgi:transcription termination factor NusA